MKTDRRLLAAAAAVIVLAAGWWALSGPGAGTGAGRASGSASTGDRSQRIDDVRLETLRAAPPEPGSTERNLFLFGPAPAPAAAEPAPETPPVPAPSEVLPPPGPPPPPPLPPIPFKFIGLVERPGAVRIAVLTDGRTVVHGREGDIIEGRYRLLRVGTDAVELSYADGRGRQTIRLTGQ